MASSSDVRGPFQAARSSPSLRSAPEFFLNALDTNENPVNDGSGWEMSPMDKIKYFCIAAAILATLCILMARCQFSHGARTLLRFVSFVTLHLVDYTTNVLTMVVVYSTHRHYLFILAPVHIIIGIFCLYTTATGIPWQNWSCPPIIKFVIMLVFFGLMQGIQVKLAHDDFKEQRRSQNRSEDENDNAIPSMMPARFHLKAMDGVLEGTAFAFVSMYALLKHRWQTDTAGTLSGLTSYEMLILYLGAFTSFLTIGLALLEVDFRTSAALQRLCQSNFAQARHLVFRSSEVAFRLLTVLVFVTFMRPMKHIWWVAFILVAADYLFGVILLLCLGGRDPIREAAVLLGVPLFMVNVMQFVDTPGMSLQAQRISAVVLPFRTLELVGVLVFCSVWAPYVDRETLNTGVTEKVPMWTFMWEDHTEWVVAWGMSCVLYYVLLLTYAQRMKPEADLHLAVANNDIDCLKTLLTGDLVLDINRYGPDGRTPLHLAAVRSKVECMKLLIEQKANIHARDNGRKRHTALHLAVMSSTGKEIAAIRYLCQICCSDEQFLNASNSDGDTALHVAARRQNAAALKELLSQRHIELKLRNKKGLTAADCVPSDKFGFDRDSSECAITDLFRDAEAGRPPGGSRPNTPATGAIAGISMQPVSTKQSAGTTELSPIISTSSSSSQSPRHPPSPEKNGGDAKPNANPNATEPAEGGNSSASTERLERAANGPEQNLVPLVHMTKESEESFLKRGNFGNDPPMNANAARNNATTVTNCGISSFMLSAGLGALSRAFLNSINEDEESSASDTNQVKASFDDFSEIKPIGEGAFGKVVLVRHRESGEEFAMKLMDKAKFKAQKITSKAVSEQYILKTTRHPFVVALQYAFQGSTFWALVMEFCPNGDLQDLLVKKGTPSLPLPECARLGGQVLLGVEHLHRISVIFRDLKLENVVLDKHHNAKLTDFGLAKKLYTAADARTMCGSYGYAAPEIMLNTGRYTYAVDLYSFGVMLYMLLSGGEQAQNNPKQRLPPMRHSSLRRKLKTEAEKTPRAFWASEGVGAHALLMNLTSEESVKRGTAESVKNNRFFSEQLGGPVDDLMLEAVALEAEEEVARLQRAASTSRQQSASSGSQGARQTSSPSNRQNST